MLEEFEDLNITVSGVTLVGKRSPAAAARPDGPDRPALLLLHGHPENHLMWHRVAPAIADSYTLVMPDLRGYGRSGRPEAGVDHSNFSNRAMATDLIELMTALGHESFYVCGHDRGGRVAARMAADHPDRVRKAMLLDIAPTLAMYESTTRDFAAAYWHWFFLTQPAPMPETLIDADPRAYIEGVMGTRYAGLAPFPRSVLDSYIDGFRGADRARGACEDYRASAGIDLDHDRADIAAGNLIRPELRILWARHGVIERLFEPLRLWGEIATTVSGRSLDCGHYLPEEAPAEVISEIRSYFSAAE